MSNDFRETTITVAGVAHVIRTERIGTMRTIKHLEAAHTKAVRAAVIDLRRANADNMEAVAEAKVSKLGGLPTRDLIIREARTRANQARRGTLPTYGAYDDARKGFPKAPSGKPVPSYLVEIAPGHYATAEAARSLGAEELADEVLPGLELRRYGRKWVLCHVLSVTEERPNVHIGPVFKTRERAREVARTELAHLDWTRSTEDLLADPVAGPTVRLIKWREFVAASKRNAWAKEKVSKAEAEIAALAHTLAA
ncbi:hypothetical protein [Streptomyces scopuliridis]|uniref:Uncharacterized protein n=1 Tax=Streptomyces scopuliridis TaxID=452529 RepID=A0ACD4ZSJ5_9ACTN|nr:hypothetical protein [Streptomyces scopuliridis]WSC01263.1 hypothetical protein OG835_32545 [Streptomyces scopuliridis]